MSNFTSPFLYIHFPLLPYFSNCINSLVGPPGPALTPSLAPLPAPTPQLVKVSTYYLNFSGDSELLVHLGNAVKAAEAYPPPPPPTTTSKDHQPPPHKMENAALYATSNQVLENIYLTLDKKSSRRKKFMNN